MGRKSQGERDALLLEMAETQFQLRWPDRVIREGGIVDGVCWFITVTHSRGYVLVPSSGHPWSERWLIPTRGQVETLMRSPFDVFSLKHPWIVLRHGDNRPMASVERSREMAAFVAKIGADAKKYAGQDLPGLDLTPLPLTLPAKPQPTRFRHLDVQHLSVQNLNTPNEKGNPF